MKFNGFDWDSGNSSKCTKHGVSKEAVEQLFHQDITVFDDPHDAGKEQRFRAVGQDESARYIFIVFCIREKEGLTLIRPISARYMHEKEVKSYDRQN